jgi:uncharacterized membrane protein YcaP (DUF421 family)
VDWIAQNAASLVMIPASAAGIYLAVVLATRIWGLRSFSKMSGFDFAMTVAVGSVVASTVVAPTPRLLQGVAGVASIFVLQWIVARARIGTRAARRLVDNEPLLLMDGGTLLEANLDAAGVTRADLVAKLREANVLRRSQVEAVVMETTGDISVLHTEGDGVPLERDFLLAGVRGAPAASRKGA